MTTFTESVIKQAALAWLESMGYQILFGPDMPAAERIAGRCV